MIMEMNIMTTTLKVTKRVKVTVKRRDPIGAIV